MPIIRHGYATHRRSGSTRAYRNARRDALIDAVHCAICGEEARQEDPWEAHHVYAFADHGDGPLVAAHRSCNRSLGRAGGAGVDRRL